MELGEVYALKKRLALSHRNPAACSIARVKDGEMNAASGIIS